jgi:hypothetical protein
LSTLQIGCITGSQYWQGYAAEIIVFTGTVTDSERQKVEGYLAWKWGLQSLLPSTHPYKSFAPTQQASPGTILSMLSPIVVIIINIII